MDRSYWSDIFSEEDLKPYEHKLGRRVGFGSTPAVLVIDVWYQAVESYIGGWKAVKQINMLLTSARRKKVPIIYSAITQNRPASGFPPAGVSLKDADTSITDPAQYELVREIAPQKGDMVIRKDKASLFHDTPIISVLNYFGVDTCICVGESTSGCLRATAVDAASYNYKVVVPVECAFDRSYLPHMVNLFDLDMKYADVLPLSEVLSFLENDLKQESAIGGAGRLNRSSS